MADLSFLEWQPSKAPVWLRDPRGQAWWEFWGALRDAFNREAIAAVKVRYPRFAPPDALESIGADRQLERMPDEPEPAYVSRLEGAFDAWQWGGTSKGVRDALIQTRLFDPVIDGSGTYRSPDVIDAWRYDPGSPLWARFYVQILQPHIFGPPRTLGDGCTLGDGTLLGYTGATAEQGALLRRQVRTWKAGHMRCEGIVIAISGTLLGSGAVLGDGTLLGGAAAVLPVPLPRGTK